jgi:hypothetical protein
MQQAIETKRGRGRPKKAPVSTQDQRIASQLTARANVLRATREEDIRERISGGNLITRLEKIQSELLAIHTVDLEPVQVQRLGKAAEISLALLRKILPDLSATTITRRSEESVTLSQVPEQQRAAINAAISQALGIVDNGGGSPAEGIHSQNNLTPRPRYQVSENEVVDGEYQVLPDGGVGYDSSS